MVLFETKKMEKYFVDSKSYLFWKTSSSDQVTNSNKCRLQAAATVTRRFPKYILSTIILLCVVGERGVANGFEQFPTKTPSVSPTSLPSQQPSYSKQDIENFLVFQFDDLSMFCSCCSSDKYKRGD